MENRNNGSEFNLSAEEQHVADQAAAEQSAADGAALNEVEQLKAELEAVQDRLIRQAAEFQNYKRRTEQEKLSLVDLGKIDVLKSMLGILDDLARSLEATTQIDEQANVDTAYRGLKEGVELVYRKFIEELERLGVKPIEAIGKPFNEEEHEALMQQPAPEGTAAGMVLAEFEKGYKFGDRILRHSKVVVAG